MTDEQDQAELLDDDQILTDEDRSGDAAGDALPDYPPERPLGVNTVGVTPVEEDAGESFAERTWREEPEVATSAAPATEVGELVDREATTLDDEQRLVGEASPEGARGAEQDALRLVGDDADDGETGSGGSGPSG